MPNDYLNQVKLNGTVYDIKDTTSGYTTNTGTVTGVTAGTGLSGGTINSSGTISLDTTRALSTSDIDTGTDTANKLVSAKTISDAIDNAISGIPTVDEKVKQTSINTNSNYPILLKKSANATEETNTVNATNLTSGTAISINPSTGDLNVVKINGQTVGSSPKFTDTNTTYTLSGALSSHKFTSTLTAGGSGSGTSTSDITLAAGSNITLTDDTSNRKITISATVPTVPVTDVQVDSTSILSSGVADLKTSASHPYSSTNVLATMGDIAAAGGGTVTSVRVQATSPVQSSQNTAQDTTLDTTISLADAYGDTKNPYASKTKNTVLAAPSTANGVPTFRALTDADIPSGYLKSSYTGSNFTSTINYVDDLDTSGAYMTATNSDHSGTGIGVGINGAGAGIIARGTDQVATSMVAVNTSGDVTVSGSAVTITGVVTPTNDDDAANKKYVDDAIGDVPDTITGWYGTCSTSAAEKTVTCSGYTLTAGNIIGVLFSSANIFSTPTLNVNSTGAKSIYIGNATPDGTTNVLKWSANTMVYFMYDGTYYRYITSISAADVAPSRGANTWYGTSNTSATTQAKTSTIDNFVLTKGAIISINFSTANTYTSAKLTLNVNGTGVKDIYKNNATTSSTNTLLWDANTTLTFIYDGSHYQLARQRITSDDVTKALGSQSAHKVLISSATTGTATYPSFRTLVADDLPSITTSKISDFPSSIVTDVQVDSTSIITSGVADLKTSTSHPYSSTNALATLADIEAAGGANDGVLKLQKNTGTASAIFSANQAGDSTLKFTTTSVGSASGWSAGTMASIDTSKFSGGSYTQGTFSQGSFTQGTDSFTAATMSSSVGSTTTSVTSPTTMTISFTGGSFTQGTDSYTKPTHGTDSFTAGKLNSGFYTAGTAPSLTVTSTTVVNDLSKV